MSRSGYIDDEYDWHTIMYRGSVASALRGRRGQGFLQEMLAALDSLPEKKLIHGELEEDGAVCAIGAVGRARGIDMNGIDPDDSQKIAQVFDIAPALAREIVYENDESGYHKETPEARFHRMRAWTISQIMEECDAEKRAA